MRRAQARARDALVRRVLIAEHELAGGLAHQVGQIELAEIAQLREVASALGDPSRAFGEPRRLLALGYPYALEVSPEDLAHWRAERPSEATDGRGLAVLVMTVAVCLSLWGVSDPPSGIGLVSVLALEGVTVAGAVRPALRRMARQAVFTLGVLACVRGFRYGVATLLPGVAGLVAAFLIGQKGVRGVD